MLWCRSATFCVTWRSGDAIWAFVHSFLYLVASVTPAQRARVPFFLFAVLSTVDVSGGFASGTAPLSLSLPFGPSRSKRKIERKKKAALGQTHRLASSSSSADLQSPLCRFFFFFFPCAPATTHRLCCACVVRACAGWADAAHGRCAVRPPRLRLCAAGR